VMVPERSGGLFVLVAGWPGSGKSTLAAALASRLGLPLLAKDEIKEALMDALGDPRTVADSRRLGRAAVLALLRVARTCPGAVMDSTWFDYAHRAKRSGAVGRAVAVTRARSRDRSRHLRRGRPGRPRRQD
jgi:predicted kinase